MNLFEETTGNPNLKRDSFKEFAEVFFRINDLTVDWSQEEAEGFIESADKAADNLREYSGNDLYTRMITLGSIFGEALCIVHAGFWTFSESQNRWVVSYVDSKGDFVHINIFNKLKKYLENGETDSITEFCKIFK